MPIIITNDDDQAEGVEQEAGETESTRGSGLQDFDDLGYFYDPAPCHDGQTEKFRDSVFQTVDMIQLDVVN